MVILMIMIMAKVVTIDAHIIRQVVFISGNFLTVKELIGVNLNNWIYFPYYHHHMSNKIIHNELLPDFKVYLDLL